jgi:methylmalonyl-CoA decarboxylase
MRYLQTDLTDTIATIRLDHYRKRNALGAGLIEEMLEALRGFEAAGARAIVLRTATPEKVWSAGHDVEELPQANLEPLPYSDPLERLLRAVREYPAPVLAMVHGSVWGGACDLVVNCDIVIGDPTCAFAITPAKLGLPYNATGFQSFLSRLPLNIVKEMFFTADLLPAGRAEQTGLVNRIVPEADLETTVYGLAKTIASRSAAAVSVAKAALNLLSQASALSAGQFEYLQGLRRSVYFGEDYREGIRAFLEKRAPEFRLPPGIPTR